MSTKPMQRARVDGAELEFEVTGAGEPVLLIHGALIAQAYAPLCAEPALNSRYRLVRYHRRGYAGSSPVKAPFSLAQQDADCHALLRHLGIERAHVVGASMGGMIAQVLAGSHPDRLASLGLIMSSSGKPLSALPRWRVIKLAFDPPGRDAPWEDRLAVEVRNISVINGPNFLPPVDALRRRVEDLRARSDYPHGMRRQFDAILGTGSLLRYTRRITAPTIVIHGTDDPMVRPRNGRNLARAIPDARFVVVDGMGHDLHEPVWRPIVEALTENFALAG